MTEITIGPAKPRGGNQPSPAWWENTPPGDAEAVQAARVKRRDPLLRALSYSACYVFARPSGRTGLSIHTLRYNVRVSLVVTPVERTSGGRRRYRELDLKWIVICTKLRATGMPISGIRRYAELVAAGPRNDKERPVSSSSSVSTSRPPPGRAGVDAG